MGFFDDPHTRRLRKDFEEMKRLREESSILEFTTKGDPPDHYDIVFHGRHLMRMRPVKFSDTARMVIKLGLEYPRHYPDARWTTEILHSNIFSSGTPCYGHFQMNPSVSLVQFVELMWDYTRMSTFNVNSSEPPGTQAWLEFFKSLPPPWDPRVLRDKVPQIPKPPPRDVGGEELVIMGSAQTGSRLKSLVEGYFEDHGLFDEVGVFDPDEWRESGFETDSDLVIILAQGMGPSQLDDFTRFLGDLGFTWEPGAEGVILLYPTER